MPRLSVPPDRDPLIHLWSERATQLTGPAATFSGAVYSRSTLPLREFEVARATIAAINDCVLCLGWRSARDVPERAGDGDVPEELYEHVIAGDLQWAGFSERERLAGLFARLFATDHLAIDDALWQRLRAAFSDDELVELALCVGSWVAFGRLNRVFDVDGGCRIDSVT